jgi:hypothetical protein
VLKFLTFPDLDELIQVDTRTANVPIPLALWRLLFSRLPSDDVHPSYPRSGSLNNGHHVVHRINRLPQTVISVESTDYDTDEEMMVPLRGVGKVLQVRATDVVLNTCTMVNSFVKTHIPHTSK